LKRADSRYSISEESTYTSLVFAPIFIGSNIVEINGCQILSNIVVVYSKKNR
jgi:hypothetical protein